MGYSSDSDYYGYSSDSDDDHDQNEKEEEEESSLDLALEELNLSPKRKKLLVLSPNGFLIHRAHPRNKSEIPPNRSPDAHYGNRYVYKRPFLEEFMKFCLERFEVGIWSSAQEQNVDGIIDCAFKELSKRLLFIWDQDRCSDYGFKSLEKKEKPLFFKELPKLWSSLANSSRGAQFSASNTLLIDDKPYKALLNPPNTGIFPKAYDAKDVLDKFLDPKGELGLYLEGLAEAEDVPSYVKEHIFGQPAIDSDHPDWEFYSKVLCRDKA